MKHYFQNTTSEKVGRREKKDGRQGGYDLNREAHRSSNLSGNHQYMQRQYTRIPKRKSSNGWCVFPR